MAGTRPADERGLTLKSFAGARNGFFRVKIDFGRKVDDSQGVPPLCPFSISFSDTYFEEFSTRGISPKRPGFLRCPFPVHRFRGEKPLRERACRADDAIA